MILFGGFGEKRVDFNSHHRLPFNKVKTGTPRRSKHIGPERVLFAGLLPIACLSCLLPYIHRTTILRMAPLTVDWDFQHQSLTKKTLHQTACWPIFWNHFLNCGYLFSDNSNFYNVEKITTKISKHKNNKCFC